MARSSHDFGEADEIDVEAIGEPGRRTFRLVVERQDDTASLWLEKEQLEFLALVIEQQIARFGQPGAQEEPPLLTLASRFPAHPTVDFQVGRMAVGFDAERTRFTFTVHTPADDEGPALTCVVTQPQALALVTRIRSVAAAGRPRCPLCGAPIDGKHLCPLANGHLLE